MSKSLFEQWANFLANEKLEMDRVGDEDRADLIELVAALAEVGRGPWTIEDKPDDPIGNHSHVRRLQNRELVCKTAIAHGIDLTAIKCAVGQFKRGKPIIGRGMLDIWRRVYTETFGDDKGTAGWFEAKRRDVKTRLAQQARESKAYWDGLQANGGVE